MPAPLTLLLLVLYPVVSVAAPGLFFWLWPRNLPAVTGLPHAVANETEKATTARLGALISLFVYGALVCGTFFWKLSFSTEANKLNPSTNAWLISALIGGYVGTAWAGVSIWLLALGAGMRREIPGLAAPLKLQIPVWVAGALAEEVWRALAIKAVLNSGRSSVVAVVIVCIVFGCGYLTMGTKRAAFACLEGAFFGFLFLWRGSLIVPLTAHLAVSAIYLWGVGQWSQDRKSRKTWQIPGTKCPVCHTDLKLLQIKLSEVFECPSCKELLSLSDGYQNVMRFVAAFGFGSLTLLTLILLTSWLPGNVGAWLTYPVSYGFATSSVFIYRRAFTRLLPPKLQRGTPYFITLNIDRRQHSKGSNGEELKG